MTLTNLPNILLNYKRITLPLATLSRYGFIVANDTPFSFEELKKSKPFFLIFMTMIMTSKKTLQSEKFHKWN